MFVDRTSRLILRQLRLDQLMIVTSETRTGIVTTPTLHNQEPGGGSVGIRRRPGWFARLRKLIGPQLMVGLGIATAVVLGWTQAPDAHGQQATLTPTPLVRPGGRFEETDLLLLYSGSWTQMADQRASGGVYRRSSVQGSQVQLTFPGPNVKWITSRGPDRGIARVWVDNEDKGTFDLYSPGEEFGFSREWGGMNGETIHTIRVEVTGQRNGAAQNAYVDIDSFTIVGAYVAEPMRFENTDPTILYGGAWQVLPVNGASQASVHRINTSGATAQFNFNNGTVQWMTTKGPNRGIARILIDNKFYEVQDLYAPSEQAAQVFAYQSLGEGPHQIRIEVTGTRSGPATDSFVDIDAFIAPSANATPQPTATQTMTPTPSPSVTTTPTATFIPSATPTIPPAPPAMRDARYFFQTSYRIDYEPFWNYFNAMGAVDTFGYPISRTFQFLGCQTQFYQRQLMQQCGTNAVQTMNLLDPDLMPYNQINFSNFPSHDPAIAGSAPGPDTPGYGSAVLSHVQRVAPDVLQSASVNFFRTFVSTVPGTNMVTDPNFAALVNLQIWGFPTSGPMPDPNNRSFIYQRFQRGIMHFDGTNGSTRGILLADWFKTIITGRNLPVDLASQAQASRFRQQYCPGAPAWVCRPGELPATDLTFAFEAQ